MMSLSDRTLPATRIVKRDSARVEPLYSAARLIKGNLLEAEELVRSAQQESESIRQAAQDVAAAAEDEAQHIRDQARDAGYREGVQAFATLLANLQLQTVRLRSRMAVDTQELAFMLAEQILGTTLDLKPQAIVELVRSALERVKLYRDITVVLHPDELERVKPHADALAERMLRVERISLRADPSLAPHDCRIETEMGVFEASVHVQLERLRICCEGLQMNEASSKSVNKEV